MELSFPLALGSLIGLWIVGKRPFIGWLWLAVMELLWIAWSIKLELYGFALLCVAYGIIYSVNLWRSIKNADTGTRD